MTAPDNVSNVALDRAVQRTIEAERAASRRRVHRAAVLGLRIHAAVFVLVQMLLVVIWALTSNGDSLWFLYPLFGWGIGLAVHAVVVRSLVRPTPHPLPDH
jgi:hypothetical protein